MNENKDPLKYLYHIIGIGNDSETPEKRYVIYETMYPKNTFTKSEENKIWVREYNDFFSKVDKNKYPNALQEYKFEPISRSFLCEKQNEYRLIYDLEVKIKNKRKETELGDLIEDIPKREERLRDIYKNA